MHRNFPESNAQPSVSLSAADSGQLDQGDPFLQRLIGSVSQQDKYIKERLEEMADDATDVSLLVPNNFHGKALETRTFSHR